MTVAQLGLAVDSKQAARAVVDLDALTAAAGRAEKGTGGLGRGSSEASATMQAMAAILQNVERHTASMAAALGRATIAVNDNARSVDRLGVEQREAAGAINSVTAALGAEAAAARTASAALDKASAAAMRNAAGSHSFNTSNVAAQFQDIGVTAAMGMSPLQIALQQGTQLSAVFNDLRAQGQGVGATLAAAFTSIVNPVSLVTLGVVGASAALIQYASNRSEVSKLDDTLKAHAANIAALKDAYGTAADGISAYVDESTSVLLTKTRTSTEALREILKASTSDIASTLQTALATSSFDASLAGYEKFGTAIEALSASAKAGQPGIVAFRQAVADIAEANATDKALQDVAKRFLDLTDEADRAERAITGSNRAIAETARVASGAIAAVKGYRDALSDLSGIALPTLSPRQLADEAYSRALEGATSTGARAAADAEYLATRTRIAEREAEKQSEIASRQAEQAAERAIRESEQQAEQLARRVEQHQQALMTEEEQERASYERRVADLEAYYEAGKFSLEEYQEWTQKAREKHSERMTEIAEEQARLEMDIRDKTLTATGNLFGALSQLMEASGQKNFAVAKAFGIGQAVINVAQGITEALKLPFPANWIQAAAVGAAGAAQIATIVSARPGSAQTPRVSGGSAGGGSSAQPSAPAEPAQPSRTAYINITGSGTSLTIDEVRQLMEQMIDLQKDGYKLVLDPQ
jgi:hypothetical protein